MKYSFRKICGVFDEVGIAYISLKGSVVCPYYPYESMRTSCGIDILIHENDFEIAVNSLETKEYRYGDRNYHDVSLYSPSKIHLELHFNIQENMDNLDAVLKFRLPSMIYSDDAITMGNINSTYKVTYTHNDNSLQSYLFQRVNTHVFKNPVEIMENIDRVTTFIREDGQQK